MLNTLNKHARALGQVRAECRAAGNPELLTSMHLEICRSERPRLEESLKLARARSQGRLPAVVHRTERTRWKITMELSDFLRLAAPEKPVEKTPAP